MLKGAIFDMDGLMIDTEKLYLKFWILAAKDYGYDMKPEHVYAIRSMARKFSIPKIKSFLGEDCPTEEIRAHRTELMREYIKENGIEVKKGLFTLLDYLRGKGIKMAVATATPSNRTEEYLHTIGAYDYFSAMVCGDMITNGKPAPDIYLTAARELGLPPQECAAFEDSPNGIASAKGAGLYTVGFKGSEIEQDTTNSAIIVSQSGDEPALKWTVSGKSELLHGALYNMLREYSLTF